MSVAERTAGMMKSDVPMLSPREEKEAAELAIAEEADKMMRLSRPGRTLEDAGPIIGED